ncbi:MAG: tetratricopeptide repeat protein [Acidobacteria bacterium]|nr:tetratricopeptide repeat protein [Acidobacteriota bacterium]
MKVLMLFVFAAVLGAQTPAEIRIEQAQEAIRKAPDSPEALNALALALARRARETSDPIYHERAEGAIARSLELAPGNIEGLKLRAWVLLGRHAFARALEVAKAVNRRVPDDVLTYGLLTDAYVELGRYREAEQAAQWMLDLRPGNIPGVTRGAYLRELFGDLEGAIEFLRIALQRTRPEETEDRAWMLTHIGHLHLLRGDLDRAEHALGQALQLFPGYHYALANLAKVKLARRRYEEAVELLRRRYQAAPHPENLFDLGAALHQAGRSQEAAATLAAFGKAARAEMDSDDNANRELIFYYLDYAGKPKEALRIAEREIGRGQDVQTLDAYGWALYKNGRRDKAREQIGRALAVGVRDPRILRHAESIKRQAADD